MSYALMQAVEASALGPRDKIIAKHLASFARDDGTSVFPGERRLAQLSSCSERTVRRAVDAFRALGVLELVRRQHPRYRTCEYVFHVERLPMPTGVQQGDLFAQLPQALPAKIGHGLKISTDFHSLHRTKWPVATGQNGR